jgi:hypothetical protein
VVSRVPRRGWDAPAFGEGEALGTPITTPVDPTQPTTLVHRQRRWRELVPFRRYDSPRSNWSARRGLRSHSKQDRNDRLIRLTTTTATAAFDDWL